MKMRLTTAATVLLCCAGLSSARPVELCSRSQDGYAGEVALVGADGDMVVALPAGRSHATSIELLECEVKPGATVERSIVFRGADRWWFEVSLPPVTLLEVVCTQRRVAGVQLLRVPTVVCARCPRNNTDGANGNESTATQDGNADLGPELHDERSRRLRRSPSQHGSHSRRRVSRAVAKQAVIAVGCVVASVLLIALCTSKKKKKSPSSTPNASTAEEADARVNDGNAPAVEEIPLALDATSQSSPAQQDGAQEPAEVTADVAGSRAESVAARTDSGVSSPESNAAEAPPSSVPEGDGTTSTPAVTAMADGADSEPASNTPGAAEGAGEATSSPSMASRERMTSPPYECIRRQADDSIEESGDGVVQRHVEENVDGYVYAKVEGRNVTPATTAKQKDKGADDGDEPSYEVVTVEPRATPPQSAVVGVGDRGRTPSERAHKSSPLQRSLPEPAGPPAFMVSGRKVSTVSNDVVTQEDDPTYSCVVDTQVMSSLAAAAPPADVGAREKSQQRMSDMYARVDDDFRSAMDGGRVAGGGGDDEYSCVFDDISKATSPVESPYSRVGGADGGAPGQIAPDGSRPDSLSTSRGGDSLASAMSSSPAHHSTVGEDDSYDQVFNARKSSTRLKSPAKSASASSRTTIPEEASSPAAGAAAAGSGEQPSHDLYARPEKSQSHSTPAAPNGSKGKDNDDVDDDDDNDDEEGAYEKPPELAPKKPGAAVLESAVTHYEAGHEDAPIVDGIPVGHSANIYAKPGKGHLEKAPATPELGQRSEMSRMLVTPQPAAVNTSNGLDDPDGGAGGDGGYAALTDDEFAAVRQGLNISSTSAVLTAAVPSAAGDQQPRRRNDSLASVGSRPDAKTPADGGDDDDDDDAIAEHLYSAVLDAELDDARQTLQTTTAAASATATSGGEASSRPKRHHGYSKLKDDILRAPQDPDATVGDPGYQEVDAKLKDELARIRAESGAESGQPSPNVSKPRNISRARPQTTRLPEEPPPALPSTQRPRANTLDAARML